MKIGDLVEIGEEEEGVRGVIVEILIHIEDEEGEIWEVPLKEVSNPVFADDE